MEQQTPIRQLLRDALGVGIALMLAYFHVGGVKLAPSCAPAPAPFVQPPVPVQPPAPFVQPPPLPVPVQADPMSATVLLKVAGKACTATILAHRPGPGRYYVLSAAHCVAGGIRKGIIALKDNRSFSFRVVRISKTADLALLEITGPEGLPVAAVAPAEPPSGCLVWTCGNGTAQPGVTRYGRITDGPQRSGQLVMQLAVSPGDSGAGVFRQDTGQLVAVVASRSGLTCWGGGVTAIRRLLAGLVAPAADCPDGTCPS